MTEFEPLEYVVFISKDADALERLRLLLDLLKKAKHGPRDNLFFEASACLTEADRSRFWRPTKEEQAERTEDWCATPLPERHQSPHLRTPWTLDAALTFTCDCDYELIDVVPIEDVYHVRFRTDSWPYGSAASLIALVEGLGHRVTGCDDGAGYEDYVPVDWLWKSKTRPT